MPTPTAQELIAQLGLVRHPEGGWFRATYRSTESVSAQALPERFDGSRAWSTAIFFLLQENDISALHRIKSDELWHFYAGSPLLIHALFPDGRHRVQRLGADCAAGDLYQAVVPAIVEAVLVQSTFLQAYHGSGSRRMTRSVTRSTALRVYASRK